VKRKEVSIMRSTFLLLQEMNLKLIRKILRSEKVFEKQGLGASLRVCFLEIV
jgi:hypothetical protein